MRFTSSQTEISEDINTCNSSLSVDNIDVTIDLTGIRMGYVNGNAGSYIICITGSKV